MVGIVAGTVTVRTIEEEHTAEERTAEERTMGETYTAEERTMGETYTAEERTMREAYTAKVEGHRKGTEERSFGEFQLALVQDYQPGRPKPCWEMKLFSYCPSIHPRRP